MPETRSRINPNHAAALTGLAVVVLLVAIWPLGWHYLIPQVAESFLVGIGNIAATAEWLWQNLVVPVFSPVGTVVPSVFA